MADLAEADAAEQRAVGVAIEKEIIALTAAPFGGVVEEALAERGAAQRVGRPDRFPRRQESARGFAQPRPFLVILAHRRPQGDAAADETRRRRVGAGKETRQSEQVGTHRRRSQCSGFEPFRDARVGFKRADRVRAPRWSACPTRSDARRASRRPDRPRRSSAPAPSGSNGMPWTSMCPACCSTRVMVLSSDIKKPGLELSAGALQLVACRNRRRDGGFPWRAPGSIPAARRRRCRHRCRRRRRR